MNWQYAPYIAALTLAAGIAVAVALYAWPRRATPGGIYFVLLMVAVAEWALGNAGELAALEIPAKIMWSKISYPGTVSVAPLWLLFAAGYSQRTQWLTRRRIAGLWVVPVIITGLAATNELHGMVWPRIVPTSDVPGAILVYEHGLGVWANMIYSYSLLLLGTFWLVRATLLAPSLYRRQVGALLIGAAIPWVGNALYVANIVPLPGLDITPIAFTLTGLAIGWAIFRFQMLDIVPIARDLLVENMRDGVLVLDAHNRVVDLNPAACRLIGCSAANAIGQQADVILAKWPELAACCRDSAKAQQELVFEDKRTLQWLELHVSPLYDRRTQLTGRLLALHNITERKQAEAAVQAAMQKEMNLAHNIQMSLLPPAAPDIPGLDIAASSLPAREVGGDLYAYYTLPHDCYGLAIGDVSGKGIPAALYMAVSTTMLAAKAPFVPDVAQLLNEMNADLMPYMTPNHMNTALCYVRLEPGDAGHYTARIANAGMVAPILRRGTQCQYLNIGGVPLGIAEAGTLYRALELPLQQSDILVLSSDGIVEARNAANEMYGFERLLARVHDAPGRNAREIHEWILSDVRSFVDNVEQHDDMTLMAVLIRENSPDVPVSQE